MPTIKDKLRYVVTLPCGTVVERDSQKAYTHAVAALEKRQGEIQTWGLLGLYASGELAERRKDTHRKLWPALPCEVLLVVVTVPLTDRQRAFLTQIGDSTVELLGTTHLVALVKRGLLERTFIGMRWWKVRRTPKGRDAVEASRSSRSLVSDEVADQDARHTRSRGSLTETTVGVSARSKYGSP